MDLEQYYAYHPDDRKYELQAGLLVSEPHPGTRHARVAGRLVFLLSQFVVPRGLGWVLTAEGGFLLASRPPTVRIPDVSFVSRSRGEGHMDSTLPFPGAPDLAVEVLSPSNTPAEMHAKVADYLAAGCPLVWLVDPASETVTVHRSLLSPKTLSGPDVLDGDEVLPGFSAPVAELFRL
jgi:Uma2 family endonuclease